jgi:predicted metal-dependent HD superfamily phosphohydrolase
MSFETALTRNVKEYVGLFITERFTEAICYHNIDHTLDVVSACEQIGRACGLDNDDLEVAILAGWFHDTGYYLGNDNHEAESAAIAEAFLAHNRVPSHRISSVKQAILATKLPQSPRTLIDKVLCDADLYHLSSNSFFEKTELLRLEISYCKGFISQTEWFRITRDFLEKHRYHTEYGIRALRPGKGSNLQSLHSLIQDQE